MILERLPVYCSIWQTCDLGAVLFVDAFTTHQCGPVSFLGLLSVAMHTHTHTCTCIILRHCSYRSAVLKSVLGIESARDRYGIGTQVGKVLLP